MTADVSYSLESLERRWQSEKTPQVGLRLSEEYRRKGDLEASIGALAAGLEVYPTHTSSRVALSRYLVDAERFEEAVPHLEQIVALDPTHLVANKLLVGAYAGVGRLDDAHDKLDIYEMMAEGDVDIERLHKLLSAPDRGSVGAPVPVHREIDQPLSAEVATATVAVDEETSVDEPVAPATATIGVEVDTETPVEGPIAVATAADERADLDFEVAAAPVPPAVTELEAAAETAVAEAPAAEIADDPFATTAEDEPFGSPLAADSSADYWREVANEGIFSLGPADGPATVVEEEEPAASAASESPPAEVADSTVTLGKLYLEQGHREEAAEVFKDVLNREPENEAAQRELEASFVPEAALEGDTGDVEESPVAVLERKRSTLTAYLAQIRRAAAAGI